MPGKDGQKSTGGKEKASQDDQTLTTGPKSSMPDQTLTTGPKSDIPDHTLTARSEDSPRSGLTLTLGGKTKRSEHTMTHTIGVGSGGLVDKIDWEVGDVIDGRFEVIELIGRGGMGIVYKVHHLEWKLDLAVKMPLASLVSDESSKARFVREAQTWVDLGLHPNIVQCWYVRELGGIPRVFMDYVDGGSLKDWIKEDKVKPGEWDIILDLVIQACDGLGYAHERGVEVHRDVKPGNMLLTKGGDLLVTDFGIVKREGAADIEVTGPKKSFSRSKGHTITETGSELGTPEYGAPEQWGKAKQADGRADIYALGVILFELCCGRRPFDDGSHSEPPHVLIGRHLSTPAPNPREFNSSIPDPLVEILNSCLAKNPDQRPSSMNEFRKELAEIYRDVVGKSYRRMVPQAADLLSDALNNRAVSFLDLDQEGEALNTWTEALKLDAYHPESIYNISLFQWREPESQITDDEVVRLLEEARYVSKRSGFYLGFIHLERAAADEAEDEFINALEDQELAQNGMLWRALGDARLAQEKYFEAEQAYKKALELTPGDSECQEGMVLAQSKTRLREDQALYCWQRCCRAFESGHHAGVTSVALSSNSRIAVSGSEDKTVKLWKMRTHECLWTFRGHEDHVLSVAITPQGECAVSGGRDKTVRLWDTLTGRSLGTLRGHTDWVSVVAVTPNGRYAVSGSRDKTLRKWEISTGKCLWVSETFSNWINALAIVSDGRFALTGHDEENLYLWDIMTGKRTERKYYGSSLEGLGLSWSAVSALELTSDGRFIVEGNQNASLQLWDFNTGQVLQSLKGGHDEKITSLAVTPNGKYVISGSEDTNLCLWDLNKDECSWTFEGHKEGVTSLKMTQNGRFVLSGSRDTTLRIWDIKTHKCVWTFWGQQGHEEGVTAVTMALHGRFIVSASQDMTLRLWDFVTAKCLKTYEGHVKDVMSVAITPNGRYAVSASRDATLLLWDLGTTTCLRTFQGHQKDVTAVVVTPDGKFIVSGSEDRTVKVWELGTAKCLRTLEGHQDGVTSVTITPDGRFLISGSHDKTLRFWRLSSGKCLRTFNGHEAGVNSVAIMSDARFVVSGSQDYTIRLWHIATGKCIRTFKGHKESVNTVAITPNKQYIVSGSDDTTLRLWDLATANCLRTFTGHKDGITSTVITQDGQFVVSGSKDHSLRVWNLDIPEAQRYEAGVQLCRQRNQEELQWSKDRFRKRMAWAKAAWENGKATTAYKYLTQARSIAGYERAPELLELKATIGQVLQRKNLRGEWLLWSGEEHHGRITTTAITPDGQIVVSGSEDMTLRSWELATGKCLQLFDGHWLGVSSVVITPDGRFVVSGSEDSDLRLWDLATAKCLRTYKGHEQEVTAVTITRYGRFIISGSKDGTLRMWNPSTKKCLQVFKGHRQAVTAVTVTPDRRHVISGSADRTLRLWERTTGKCLRTFKGHKQRVNALALSPDGRFILSGSSDNTLRLWNLATAKNLLFLRGHEDEVTSVAISSDGRFAISGSQDKTLQLWDLATGMNLWTFRGYQQGVNTVAITPDGRFVASGSDDNILRTRELDWDLETNETVPSVGEEHTKSSQFINRITTMFTGNKKK